MDVKSLAVAMGIGAVAGAIGILTLQQNNPARKLASQAASKVEDTAQKVAEKMTQKLNM